ncbi:MAG TPA: NAD(+)/NADH kinase, partial [Acidimicrobiales bacterium]|nr:NAD(+)/NADH kinase [Acidimicrobiales bacterium]
MNANTDAATGTDTAIGSAGSPLPLPLAVGLVVNPRSGTDVRRAVAAAGAVTIEDKANVVRRVVLGAREAGVDRFVVHTDTHRIVQRATETMRGLDLHWLDYEMTFTEEDTVAAVAAMRDLGCGVVVVLGGDGTNRAAARAWPDLVVVPLSTGTNNAFPVLAEATIAGAAAGHVATGRVPVDEVTRRAMVVRVRPDGASTPDDLALVDAVAVDDPYLGSFELFEPANLRTAVVSRADPASVGFAGVGGLVEPVGLDED